MPAWQTRGQPVALAAVARAVASGAPPQALLFAGPPGAGKTTLAIDLASGLHCTDPDPGARPCGACAGCRKVAHGNHPDLIRLAPGGAGRQIRIGDRENPDPGTVRHLVRELARLPSEGRVRLAIIADADRMNADAQNALLKVLEEPSAAACVVLCVADEDALLPTVRSRCARVRLCAVSSAEIADLLEERGLADAPRAAVLARLADGSPGRAVTLAQSPESVQLHDRLVRELLDLLRAGRRTRLAAAASLISAATEFDDALRSADTTEASDRPELGRQHGSRRTTGAGRAASRTAGIPAIAAPTADASHGRDAVAGEDADAGREGAGGPEAGGPEDGTADGAGRKSSPAARRAGVIAVTSVWRTLARDLAVAGRGGRAEIRLIGLLEEIVAAARLVDHRRFERFLERLDATAGLLERNANPELLLDVLLLAWPHVPETDRESPAVSSAAVPVAGRLD